MKHFITTAIAVGLGLAAAPAFAGSKSFARADANGDGGINAAEFYRSQPVEHHRFFHFADRENDGKLDAEEYKTVNRLIDRRNYRSGE
ncbi:MAG: hypothetical protein KTR21_03670 [Rhodobacteraceae bacterium]|nr:hypothetical protein [Paracoccaceae bacterium]